MNASEILLENILSRLGIPFSKIPESKLRTPDYKVSFGPTDTFWEVKELRENESEKNILAQIELYQHKTYSIDSDRIESSIRSAAGQFKSFGVTDQPCIVVLADLRDFAVMDFLFIQAVQSKMIGIGHYMKNSNGQYFECSREIGLLTKRKKYISAIAIIFKATEEIVFLHNPNASKPLIGGPLTSMFEHHYIATDGQLGLEWKKMKDQRCIF